MLSQPAIRSLSILACLVFSTGLISCGTSYSHTEPVDLLLSQGMVKPKGKLKKAQWLIGKWKRINSETGMQTMEEWEITREREFTGKAFTLKEGDTLVVEYLTLEEKDGKLIYRVDVIQNNEPVEFVLTGSSYHRFVFENPDHDFPKKIEYMLGKDDRLYAMILGDGKAISYVFEKE